MDSADRQWDSEKDVRNVRNFSVERLPSGGTKSCMPQQTRYAGVCADWAPKLCVFRNTPNPHRDRPRHCQWASSLVHSVCDWPDSYRFEKRPPRWRYGAVRLAPTIDIEQMDCQLEISRVDLCVRTYVRDTLARDRIVYFRFSCMTAWQELVFGGIDFGAANNGRGGGFGGK